MSNSILFLSESLLWFLMHLQTILCVPTKNGVVELGSTDLVSLLIQGLLCELYNGSQIFMWKIS